MNKFLFLMMILTLLNTTFASDAASVYEALDVEEVDLSPGAIGALNTAKTVGRLSCTRTQIVYPDAKPNYACKLEEKLLCLIPEGCPDFNSDLQDKDIYEALSVDEVPIGVASGLSQLQEKRVDNLKCSKFDYFIDYWRSSYHCELK